jgi:hypothetical protein
LLDKTRRDATMGKTAQVCDHCHEELGDNPVHVGDKVYCTEACAFEAGRAQKCGEHTDVYIKTLDKPDRE